MVVLSVSVITESREEVSGFDHDMQCTSPTRISVLKDGQEIDMFVPCGHCAACRIAKKREWTIRLLNEKSYWKESVFVTLTYNDENLPSDGGLHKEHLQGFFKRLRKCLGADKRIKYFACGEYGDRHGRAHYHAIIFGCGLGDSDKIAAAWPFGFTKVDLITMYRLQYVCGYVQKKLSGDARKAVYGSKQGPFQLQSQGLGRRYVEDNKRDLLHDGCIETFTGQKFGLPRYYRKVLGDEYDSERACEASFEARKATVRRHGGLAGDDTPSWLVDAEYYRLGMKYDSSLNRSRDVANESRMKKLEMSLERRKR